MFFLRELRQHWTQILRAREAMAAHQASPAVSNQATLDELAGTESPEGVSPDKVSGVGGSAPSPSWSENLGGAGSVLDKMAKPKTPTRKEPKAGYERNDVGLQKTAIEGTRISRGSGKVSADGAVHLAGSRASKDASGAEVHEGIGGHLGVEGGGLSARRRTVGSRDAEGEVIDGTDAQATLGPDGIGLKHSRTTQGNTTGTTLALDGKGLKLGRSVTEGEYERSGSLTVADGRYGAGGSFGKEKGANFGGSFAIGEDGYDLGVKAGYGKASGSFEFSSMDDKQVASFGGADSELGQVLGGTTVGYALMNGESMAGSLKVSSGAFGASLGGGVSSSQSAELHTTSANLLESLKTDPGALDRAWATQAPFQQLGDKPALDEAGLKKLASERPEVYRELVAGQMRDRVQGVNTLQDMDLDAMRAGEAFSLKSGEGWNASGGVEVYGVAASLGVSGQEAEQMTIARTGDESFTVTMKAMDAEALNAGIGVEGAISAGLEHTDTDQTDIRFEVTGPEGLEALKEFQTTGLLPGADKVVDDPVALSQFQMARYLYDLSVDEDAPTWASPEIAQAFLRKTASKLNSKMMESQDWGLSEAGGPGVQYTNHQFTRTDKTASTLNLLTFTDWLSWGGGSTHTQWDQKYVQDGDDRTAYGTKHDEDNWFDPDESTTMVANPKEAHLIDKLGGKHEIELAMFTEQAMSGKQRTSISEIEGVHGIPDAVRDAWVDGDWDDSPVVQARLAWTQEHLDIFANATERNADFWSDATDKVTPFLKTMQGKGRSFGGSFDLQKAIYDDVAGDTLRPVLQEMGYDEHLLTFDRPAWDPRRGEADEAIAAIAEKLASVQGPEQFAELSETQQSLYLTSYAMEAISDDGDPWNAVAMALQVPDADQRNRHLRELFHVIEKRKPDTHAMTDLIAHIQSAPYLEKNERNALLGTVSVNLKDDRVERRAQEIQGAEDPADYIAGKMFSDSKGLMREFSGVEIALHGGIAGYAYGEQQVEQLKDASADATVDWLQAAEKAGGTALMDQVLQRASARDPGFVATLYSKTMKVDPVRAELILELLEKTPSHQGFVQEHRALRKQVGDFFSGQMPWWAE